MLIIYIRVFIKWSEKLCDISTYFIWSHIVELKTIYHLSEFINIERKKIITYASNVCLILFINNKMVWTEFAHFSRFYNITPHVYSFNIFLTTVQIRQSVLSNNLFKVYVLRITSTSIQSSIPFVNIIQLTKSKILNKSSLLAKLTSDKNVLNILNTALFTQ